jgi:predicted  nucleic acid-binding Zn-ribbon protein
VQAASQTIETAIVADPEASRLRDQRKSVVEQLRNSRDLSKDSARKELRELSALMADTDAGLAHFESRIAEVGERLRAARQLINATSAALDGWADAHAQLAVAARNKSTVSVSALVDASTELKALVARIREL